MKGTILFLFFVVLVTFVVPLTYVEAQIGDGDDEGPYMEEPITSEEDDDEGPAEMGEEESLPEKKPSSGQPEDDDNI